MKQRLKRIRPPTTPRLSIAITLTIVAGFLAALVVMVSSLASTKIPDVLQPYVPYSWLALPIILLLGIGVAVWQVSYASGQAANSPSATPPASQPSLPSAGGSTSPALVPQPASTPATTPAPATLPIVSPAPASGPSLYHTGVISYATKDEQFVKKLYVDLWTNGVPCWFAEHDLKQGDKLRAEIYQAIRQQEKLLLVLSKNAIESLWVEEEVNVALDREHQQPGALLLFPLRLDNEVLTTDKYWAITVRQRRIGDFRQWEQDAEYQQALQLLLRDLHV